MITTISALAIGFLLLLILISCNSIDRNGKLLIKQNNTIIKLKIHELKIKPKVKKVETRKEVKLSKTENANLKKIGINF